MGTLDEHYAAQRARLDAEALSKREADARRADAAASVKAVERQLASETRRFLRAMEDVGDWRFRAPRQEGILRRRPVVHWWLLVRETTPDRDGTGRSASGVALDIDGNLHWVDRGGLADRPSFPWMVAPDDVSRGMAAVLADAGAALPPGRPGG